MLGHTCRHLALLAFLLGGAAVCHGQEEADKDPFEGFNRAVFAFNEQADRFILKPVARGYRFVTPDPVERGVVRVFDNLGEIVTVANDLLQGKFGQAANDSGRFVINTTLGVGGLFDVAANMGLEKNEKEDFGQTLGAWGVSSGPYIVLPFLGPSTLRDAPSRVVDNYANPINEIDHVPTRNSVYGVRTVSDRATLLEAEKLIRGDKYTFMRDVFLQRREYLVRDGELEDSFGNGYDDPYSSEDFYE